MKTQSPEYRMVREFQTRFMDTVNDEPTLPPLGVLQLRAMLHDEEFIEYFRANNIVDVVDGLTDLSYVLHGTAIVCGLEVKGGATCADIGGNIAVLRRLLINPRKPGDDPIGYWSGTVQDFISRAVGGIKSKFVQLGVPYSACFAEVHRSNMTKLWTLDETLAKRPNQGDTVTSTEDFHLSADSKPDHRRVFMVKNSSGKILKPPGYSPANLAAIVATSQAGGDQ